jgi:hypothetical protein
MSLLIHLKILLKVPIFISNITIWSSEQKSINVVDCGVVQRPAASTELTLA